MIREDHPHSAALRRFHGLEAGGTAVAGQQQSGPVHRRLLDGGQRHAVALAHPMRHVVAHLSPQTAQSLHQQHRGRHSVDVIVPVDEDRLAPRQGLLQEVHGSRHVPHQERIVAVSQAGFQIGSPLDGIRDAPPDHQRGQDRRDAQGRAQRLSACPIGNAHGDPLRSQHARPSSNSAPGAAVLPAIQRVRMMVAGSAP